LIEFVAPQTIYEDKSLNNFAKMLNLAQRAIFALNALIVIVCRGEEEVLKACQKHLKAYTSPSNT